MRPARSSAGTGRSMSALWPRDPTRDPSPVGPLVALSRTPAWTSQRQFPLCHVHRGQLAEAFGTRFWPLKHDTVKTEESGGPRPSSASHRAGRLRRLRQTGGDCVQCPLSEMEASRCSHDVR